MINQFKTIALLGILSIFVVFVGGAIAGESGLFIGLIFALLFNGVSYFFSDKMALAASGAKPVTESEAPDLYEITRTLSKKADIPMPRLFIIPQMQANAFATGRDPNNAAVAVTKGLMEYLKKEEVAAVVAHELGHVKNRDILISSIASVLASVISYIANFGYFFMSSNNEDGPNPVVSLILMIVAPIAATIIQFAISRQREYLADETAANLIGSSQPMISALQTIHNTVRQAPMNHANPAFSSMYISNPFSGQNVMNLFSTHPSLEDRVKHLESLKI